MVNDLFPVETTSVGGYFGFKVLIVEGWIFYWGGVESSGVGSEVEKNFVGG